MEIEPNNGYQNKFSSLIVENLYLNEEFADFHFICKINDDERERIPAHKILLRGSDVFRAMFNEEWEDKTEVEIVDASATAFKEFLQFFYFSQVKLSMGNVGYVMNLGNKYNVPDCMEVCCKFLIDSITDDNVCTAYGLARFFEQEKLSKYCEAIIIRTDTKALVSSNGFLESDRKALKYILDLDFISCSEFELFEACMNWVKFKTGEEQLTREIVQAQLGDAFYGFRFSSMPLEELPMLLSSYGKLFSADELIEIPQLMAAKKMEQIQVDGCKIFSDKERKPIMDFVHVGEDVVCDRILSYFFATKPYYIKNLELTTFSVDEPLLLKGLTVSQIYVYKNYNYYNFEFNMATEIEIAQVLEESNAPILFKHKTRLNHVSETDIILSKPILVRTNFMYEIRLKQNAPTNCVMGSLFKFKVQLDSDVTVQFHRDSTAKDDSIARGLVRKLKFARI